MNSYMYIFPTKTFEFKFASHKEIVLLLKDILQYFKAAIYVDDFNEQRHHSSNFLL